MNKKSVAVLLASVVLLSACGGKKEEVKKEKIDVSMFEENDKKQSKYKGYTVEEVYLNGKKEKIDVQSHGEHYHIIFNGKKYMISKEQYNELKNNKDNKIVLDSENEEKKLSEINPDEIESYFKHGDHWHIKLKNGKEIVTHDDPSSIAKGKEKNVATVNASQLSGKEIVSKWKHGDHWHVRLADGTEYITYDNPDNIGSNGNSSNGNANVVNVATKEQLSGKEIVSSWKHDDHWHVKLADGTEYVTYEDPNGSTSSNTNTDKNKENNKNNARVEVIKKDDLKGKEIVSIWQHGNHWHVKLADGTEYVTYEDPTGKKTLDEINIGKNNDSLNSENNEPNKNNGNNDNSENNKDKINVTKIVKHDDHYHVTINGLERVMSQSELDELKKKVRTLPEIEVWKDEEEQHNEEHHTELMHFHGVKGHYHPNDITEIEAHSSKEKEIKSYKWYIKRLNSNTFEEIKGQTEKVLKIKVSVEDNDAEIKAEALNNAGKVIDSCTKKIEVIDHGTNSGEHADENIDKNEPHVDMHFHGDSEYENGDTLQIYAHSSLKSVKSYKWFIKKLNDEKFIEIKGKNQPIFDLKVDLTYDKAVLKAQAVDENGKVVDSYSIKLTVSEKIDKTSKNGENIMINDLKISPEVVEVLKSSETQFAGNTKFPYDTKDREKVLKFLNQVIYMNLENIDNVENDGIMKHLHNIQGFSFGKNINTEKINKLLDENKDIREKLAYLSFDNSDIKTLEFLNKIKDFEQLELNGINNIDFSKVEDRVLNNIWKLYIQDSDISDISFLEKMPLIEKLNLSSTKVQDISHVGKLKNLRIFTFTNNKIDNLNPLENCSNLEQLIIDRTTNTNAKQINLDFVNKTNISVLLMKDCKTSDLTALNGNTKLKQLDASNSYLLKGDKLPTLPNIEGLNLSGTFVTSLNDIPVYPKLKSLAMDRTGLENLDGIQKQTSLEMATFVGCMINTFKISSPAIKLRALSLTDNQISSWDGYKENFPNVKNVIVVKNPIHGTKPEN